MIKAGRPYAPYQEDGLRFVDGDIEEIYFVYK